MGTLHKVVFTTGGVVALLASALAFLTGFSQMFHLFGDTTDQEAAHFVLAAGVALSLFFAAAASFTAAFTKSAIPSAASAALSCSILLVSGPWAWKHPQQESYERGPLPTNPWDPKTPDTIVWEALVAVGVILLVLGYLLVRCLRAQHVKRGSRGVAIVLAPTAVVAAGALVLAVSLTSNDNLPPADEPNSVKASALLVAPEIVTSDSTDKSVTYHLDLRDSASRRLNSDTKTKSIESIYTAAGVSLDIPKRTVDGGTVELDPSSHLTLTFLSASLPETTPDTPWFTQKQTAYQAVLPFAADDLGPTKTTSKTYHLATLGETSGELGTLHLPVTSRGESIARWDRTSWVLVPSENDGRTASATVDQPGVYATIRLSTDGKRTLDPRLAHSIDGTQTFLVPGARVEAYDYAPDQVESPTTSFEADITDSAGKHHYATAASSTEQPSAGFTVPEGVAEGKGTLTIRATDDFGGTGESSWPVEVIKSLPANDVKATVEQVGDDLIVSWTSDLQPSAWTIQGVSKYQGTRTGGGTFGCGTEFGPGTRKVLVPVSQITSEGGVATHVELRLTAAYSGLSEPLPRSYGTDVLGVTNSVFVDTVTSSKRPATCQGL